MSGVNRAGVELSPAIGSVAPTARTNTQGSTLSPEVRSRDVMAYLVHDVVAEAMRLGLHDASSPSAGGVRKVMRRG